MGGKLLSSLTFARSHTRVAAVLIDEIDLIALEARMPFEEINNTASSWKQGAKKTRPRSRDRGLRCCGRRSSG